jgi:hypothetical protein
VSLGAERPILGPRITNFSNATTSPPAAEIARPQGGFLELSRPPQGAKVNHTTRGTKTPFLRSGVLAALRGVFGGGGSGAGFVGVGRTSSLRLLGLLTVLAVAFLALTASSALAATSRPGEAPITEANGVAFSAPAGLALDSSGDLWVSDGAGGVGSGLVSKFSPTGTFLAQNDGTGSWAASRTLESLAFSEAAGEVLVSDSNHDDIWGLKATDASDSGTDLFGGPWDPTHSGCCFIRAAVDNSGGTTDGDIYVSNGSTVSRVRATGPEAFEPAPFSESASYISGEQLTGPFTAPNAVAVDSSGDLYVGASDGVFVYEPGGNLIHEFTEAGGVPLGAVAAVAVDPTSGNILLAERTAVVELSPSGALQERITEAGGSPFGEVLGLAVGATGTLYVADRPNHRVDVFGAAVPAVSPVTGPAVDLTATTATLTGTVDPAGIPLTECRFEYVTEAAFQATGFTDLSSGGARECEPPFGSIPASGQTPVSAALAGLSPGVVYRYRLSAANADGANHGAALAIPRIVIGESVLGVTAESAQLLAEIDPSGVGTEYHFEYLTEAGYEANGDSFSGPSLPTAVPVPAALLPGTQGPTAVTQVIQGLTPATQYRFRVLAVNSLGTVAGAGRVFTTQGPASLLLPDDRGWELVSPTEKRAAQIEPIKETGIVQASASGDAITYTANAATEPQLPGVGKGQVNVLSARAAAGWSSQDLGIAHDTATGPAPGFGLEHYFFSEDLSHAFIQPFGRFTPSVSPEASEQTPYLRTTYLGSEPSAFCRPVEASCYHPLVTGKEGFANVPAGTVFGEPDCKPLRAACGPRFLSASPDGSHAVLSSVAPLVVGAPAGGIDGGGEPVGPLYEWNASVPPAEQLKLISLLPGSTTQTVENPALGFKGHAIRGAVSDDGSRVVFSEDNINPGDPQRLFLRDTAADGGQGETIQLDAAGCAGCESGLGRFQSATPDGSRVFFTSPRRLTADSGADPNSAKADLYECRIVQTLGGEDECALTDLTPANGGEGASVLGTMIGASSDGSTLYFVADGVLTALPDSQGAHAVQGDCAEGGARPDRLCNLYAYREGQTRLVAVLSEADQNDWKENLSGMPARISPDGDWLAFLAQEPLTGYDTRDRATGAPVAELYLYDARANLLRCASCDPTGARPRGFEYEKLEPGSGGLVGGPVGIWSPPTALVAATVPGWIANAGAGTVTYRQPRYLSDSGRLFFNSGDALVPQDSNGTWDVYEYEPPGVGTCTEALPTFSVRSGGCVSLISSGASSKESAFLDASEDGDDVFFLTSSRLTGKDLDNSRDVYDARVGGGEHEPVKPVECDGDACQRPATPPVDSTPGSLTFQGAGNVVECPKGKVKKNDKCVKQKSKKHKKHHKKKGKKSRKRANSKHGGHK